MGEWLFRTFDCKITTFLRHMQIYLQYYSFFCIVSCSIACIDDIEKKQ